MLAIHFVVGLLKFNALDVKGVQAAVERLYGVHAKKSSGKPQAFPNFVVILYTLLYHTRCVNFLKVVNQPTKNVRQGGERVCNFNFGV